MNRILYLDGNSRSLDARPAKLQDDPWYSIVGPAPSLSRPLARDNEPFGASSSAMLSKVLKEVDLPLHLTNLVKEPCSAEKAPPAALVRRYHPRLIRELKMVNPGRILALGSTVAEVLCPGFTNLREDHGTLFFNSEIGCVVVPTFHFAAVGKDPTKMPLFARDLWRFTTLPLPDKPAYEEILKGAPKFPKGSHVIIDIETTGLNPRECDIMSIGLIVDEQNEAFEDGEIEINLPMIMKAPTKEQLVQLYQNLKESSCTLIGHNFSFDLDWLIEKSGIEFWDVKVIDTMLMAHVLGEEILSLKHLTTMHTERPGSRAFGGPADYGYLAEDVLSTQELYHLLLDRGGMEAFASKLLCSVVPHTVRMRNRGVYVDRKRMAGLFPQYQEKVAANTAILNGLAGKEVNWNSAGQVVAFLLSQGVKLTEKTDAGAYTVKETVMLKLAEKYPVAKQILDLREIQKEMEFFSSYLERTSDGHPFLHPRLQLAGTRTGRLSCTDPNVQQVKRTGPIKTVYVPRWPGGSIGLIDLSQAELRVAALLSGDDVFVQALLSEDVHRTIASWEFHKAPEDVTAAERKRSKAITFGLLYGGSPAGLADRAGITEEDVENILHAFYDRFKGLMKFIKDTKAMAIRKGHVKTLFGNVRDLRSIIELNGVKDATRKAINTPIQGIASYIALMILNYCAEQMYRRGMKSDMMFGVHDSALAEIYPGEEEAVGKIVQEAFANLVNSPLSGLSLWSDLPLVGEFIIGDSWAAVESTNENYNPRIKIPCSSLTDAELGGVISERDDTGATDDQEDSSAEPL